MCGEINSQETNKRHILVESRNIFHKGITMRRATGFGHPPHFISTTFSLYKPLLPKLEPRRAKNKIEEEELVAYKSGIHLGRKTVLNQF